MSPSTTSSATRLPTHLDLPSTDNLPVDNAYQPTQWRILIDSITPHLRQLHPDGQYLAVIDMGIYFRITNPPLRGCRCPDFFYVPGVPPVLPDSAFRRSYVLWNDLVPPTLIIELVSDESRGTEHDKTPEEGKFWIYENAIKAPYYAIYDPDTTKIELYQLKRGKYHLLNAGEDGLYAIPQMHVRLGTHYDFHDGMTLNWLRFFDEEGTMFPLQAEAEALKTEKERKRAEREKRKADREKERADSEKERANSEKERANSEKDRANSEKERADRLAAKLRELGIDPERI
jgi:Uma2 family endonuclease